MKNEELPIIEKYELMPGKWVDVVRGDTIPGGFKRLAIDGVYTKSKVDNLVFATNSLGTGALALTFSLQGSDKYPIIFLSKLDSRSAALSLCEKMGAQLDFSGNSKPADSDGLRKEALEKYPGATYEVLPLGLENEEVRENIIKLGKSIFSGKVPREIWVATASGLTIRSLQLALPNVQFHAVLVKGNNPNVGNAEIHIPEERFEQLATIIPSYSSNLNYDAKVWKVLIQHFKIKEREFGTGVTIFNIA